MSRHDPIPAMAAPWKIDLVPDRPGGGYRIEGADGGKIRIYGSRADVDLIVESVNENARLREALELIAAPMRPDGSWNRDRQACAELARGVLKV